MKVGVVDIGTNSIRLLITDGEVEQTRRVVVAGLGRGVDLTGRLDEGRMEETMGVLAEYGEQMDRHQVSRRRAVATSATRDAVNREVFLDQAEKVLGIRPETISGEVEAGLSFRGARAGIRLSEPVVVVDIGGGSTEIVTAAGGASVDMGSVRLTDRVLGTDRPVPAQIMTEAVVVADEVLESARPHLTARSVVGVGGTFTSLAALALDLSGYDPDRVHLSTLTSARLDDLITELSVAPIEEVAAIPSLDPARAPVILGGALVVQRVMELLGVSEVVVSERDLLDGMVASLLPGDSYT